MANGTWKIARNRSGQLPLLIVAVLSVVIVLLGRAQSSLFDGARARMTDWMAPSLEAVRTPIDGMTRWVGSLGNIFVVYSENLKLKEENARLRQWQNAAMVLDNRVKRYQMLLKAVPDPALSSVLARVIGRANRPFLETMVLNAGKASGIKPGQAVVDARGLIGRIYLTGQHTSWVILLTDLNSRIPVSIVPGNVQAMMTGDNTRSPILDTLSQNVKIKAGDQIISSGDGGLVPPGLPIGTVVSTGNGFRVALLADAAASQDVEILDFKMPVEKLPAASPGDLPATAAGLAPLSSPPPQPAPIPGVPNVPGAPAPSAAPAAAPSVAPAASSATTPPPAAPDEEDR
jgi:rod shape-determining protein MreC